MRRTALAALAALLFACNGEDSGSGPGPAVKDSSTEEAARSRADAFPAVSLPYRLSDTALLAHKGGDTVRGMGFSDLIPDSIRSKIFGKGGRLSYFPLAKMETSGGGIFYIVKGEKGRRKAALLLSYDKNGQFGAVFPFLVPDDDASTAQVSTIDKAYSISRSVIRKQPDDIIAEGKDVYAYSNESKEFTLIMTDLLDDKDMELINPIDTLSRKHKLAGDYARDKKNIISVRDGRKANLLTVFVHTEKGRTGCTGELKGDAEITSPTTAVYRQAGDPCVLKFTFTASAVILEEVEGCGARRGLECPFEGSFPRKKEPKAKNVKNNKRKS